MRTRARLRSLHQAPRSFASSPGVHLPPGAGRAVHRRRRRSASRSTRTCRRAPVARRRTSVAGRRCPLARRLPEPGRCRGSPVRSGEGAQLGEKRVADDDGCADDQVDCLNRARPGNCISRSSRSRESERTLNLVGALLRGRKWRRLRECPATRLTPPFASPTCLPPTS